MDDFKFLCGQCNKGYKNKSNLRRHINSIHNSRRFICGNFKKEYMRKVDYIKHITKHHQPLILKQDNSNIEYQSTSAHAQKEPPTSNTTTHCIENTTLIMTGETDWNKILQKDLKMSSDKEDTTLKVSIRVSTEQKINPDNSNSNLTFIMLNLL